jgi:hypothetical protein
MLGGSPFLVGAMFAAIAIGLGIYPLLILLLHMSILGGVGLAWAYKSLADLVDQPGVITGDDRGLLRDGRVVVPHDELKQGFVMPFGPAALVRIERRGMAPPMLVRVDDIASGRTLLRALGLDASQRVADVKAAPWLVTQPVQKQLLLTLGPILGVFVPLILGSAAALGKQAPFAVITLVPVLLAYIFGVVLAPMKIRIGTDGVLIRWLWKERFIPFSEIEDVVSYEEEMGGKQYAGAILHLAGGETTKICTGQKGFTDGDSESVVERLREALEEHRTQTHGTDASALSRGSRSALDWVRALKRLGAGADTDLRHAGMSLEALLSAVHDTTLDAASRAGAAVAALPYVTPAEKRRIRVAAETTALPKLRVALETVTKEGAEETEIARALEEVATDERDATEKGHRG